MWEQATRLEGPPLTISSHEHIQHLTEALPDIYWYFAARPWSIVQFERHHLLTCDTPVFLIEATDAPAGMGSGLLAAWAICLPLSRTTALLMTDPAPIADLTNREHVASGVIDRRLPPSSKLARALQGYTIGNARQFIYHHPSDAELVPHDLPEPQLSEILAPDEDFVAWGEAMRKDASG